MLELVAVIVLYGTLGALIALLIVYLIERLIKHLFRR